MMDINLKAENNLSQIRTQIKGMIPTNSKVIELGCGQGDLLFELSPQIQFGLGIDKSPFEIQKAKYKKQRNNILNLNFKCINLGNDFNPPEKYDYSIVCLFFHVIRGALAIYLLKAMKGLSTKILICGFTKPANKREEIFLWFDQKFSSNYKNFKEYQKLGYMEGILLAAGVYDFEKYDTSIPFVKIYKINWNFERKGK